MDHQTAGQSFRPPILPLYYIEDWWILILELYKYFQKHTVKRNNHCDKNTKYITWYFLVDLGPTWNKWTNLKYFKQKIRNSKFKYSIFTLCSLMPQQITWLCRNGNVLILLINHTWLALSLGCAIKDLWGFCANS